MKQKKSAKDIIDKAGELAVKYEARYRSCGQCTFLAVSEALRWGGLEIVSQDVEDRLFSGTSGFTGGTSMVIEGTCGAIISSLLAMGIAFGFDRETQVEDRLRGFCAKIQDTIIGNFKKEYGSIICRDILNIYFGRVWDLTDDEASNDFLRISHGCAIQQAVTWTTETILKEMKKRKPPA
jgi:hypothetical protein